MNYKYSFKDFINGDIVLETNMRNTNIISLKLQEYNINTKVLDEMVRVTKPVVYLHVENDCLTLLDNVVVSELNKKIANFDEIDPFEWNIKTDEFRLNQIVHVYFENEVVFFGNPKAKNITGYISCIDSKNRMCEVVNLHNIEEREWFSFDCIYPIFTIYNEERNTQEK